MTGDFRVIDGGSVVGIKPCSEAGDYWWAENVQAHEGWQEMNGFVWCDRRQAAAIVEGFTKDGLTVRRPAHLGA